MEVLPYTNKNKILVNGLPYELIDRSEDELVFKTNEVCTIQIRFNDVQKLGRKYTRSDDGRVGPGVLHEIYGDYYKSIWLTEITLPRIGNLQLLNTNKNRGLYQLCSHVMLPIGAINSFETDTATENSIDWPHLILHPITGSTLYLTDFKFPNQTDDVANYCGLEKGKKTIKTFISCSVLIAHKFVEFWDPLDYEKKKGKRIPINLLPPNII